MSIPSSISPHGNETVLIAGNTVNPTKALILLHGRGASAEDILGVIHHIQLPDDVIVLAPQAVQHTWYPFRFIMPQQENQPELDSALARVDTLVTYVETEYGINSLDIVIAGFSQGACLASEYVKRHPKRYLGTVICSGGLIGVEAEVEEKVDGTLSGTPIYIGCDQADSHIPIDRVRSTAKYFSEHEANVTLQIYLGLGHTIHKDALTFMEGVLRE